MRRAAPVFPLILAFGCASPPPPPQGAPADLAEPQVPAIPHTLGAIDRPDLHGASGMARGPSGHLYAVLERDHRLFELGSKGPGFEVLSSRAVIGAPGGVDLESVAFLDETHLIFGTETTKTDRVGDRLLFAEIQADKVVISEESLLLEYAAWGITPERNRGIEGLCTAGGTVVAAVETAGVQGEQRFAPVATLNLLERKWTYYRVGLTSDTGKLAGLTCRASPGGVEVIAIERHYEVSRIVYFNLPIAGAGKDVLATVLADTAPLFDDKIPNFEGIALDGEGRIVSISDNDYGGITGPTQMLILPPPTTAGGHQGKLAQ